MKQLFTLFAGITLTMSAYAQGAQAVVFAEGGEKFTLILNGEKQNDTPAVNVKAKNLTNDYYQARVDFEEASLPDFSNNNFMVKQGMETTYVIKKNKKGEYVLRWATEAAITNATASAPSTTNSQVKNYAVADDEPVPAPAPVTTNTAVTGGSTGGNVTMNTNVGANGMGVNQSVTVTETTKTTTSKPASTGTTGGNVSMNVGVPGVNMGINMTVTDAAMDVQESHSTTTVTTTTTTTSTPAPRPTPAPQPVVQPAPREEVVVTQAPAGGCVRQMDAASFAKAKKSISDKGFDDTRLTIAKQVTKANCLTCEQIAEVCQVFGFEETKLEFAKFAYDHCFDPNNYYTVNDVFSFESSMEELTKYVESK